MARIILIDDDELLSRTLARGLGANGHDVAVAGNGFDGVKLVREGSADLVLTDISMPHGGLPTIRVLRAEFPDLAIIAMSGNPTGLDVASTLGVSRVLPKPFTPAELAETVAETLSAVRSNDSRRPETGRRMPTLSSFSRAPGQGRP